MVSDVAATDIVRFKAEDGQEVSFTAEDVHNLVCPQATPNELALFMAMCQSRRLDPIGSKDAYLVKYGAGPAQMLTSYHVFNRVACASPDYDGIDSGVIVLDRDGQVREQPGSAWYPEAGQTLLGGWATVYLKSRSHPARVSVNLRDYNTGKSNWAKMPGFMIEKVAKSAAWRMAFPGDLRDLYVAEEMDQAAGARPVDAQVSPAQPQAPSTEPQTAAPARLSLEQAAFMHEASERLARALDKDERTVARELMDGHGDPRDHLGDWDAYAAKVAQTVEAMGGGAMGAAGPAEPAEEPDEIEF